MSVAYDDWIFEILYAFTMEKKRPSRRKQSSVGRSAEKLNKNKEKKNAKQTKVVQICLSRLRNLNNQIENEKKETRTNKPDTRSTYKRRICPFFFLSFFVKEWYAFVCARWMWKMWPLLWTEKKTIFGLGLLKNMNNWIQSKHVFNASGILLLQTNKSYIGSFYCRCVRVRLYEPLRDANDVDMMIRCYVQRWV